MTERSVLAEPECLALHQIADLNAQIMRTVHQTEPALKKNVAIHVLDRVVSMPDVRLRIINLFATVWMVIPVIRMLDAIDKSVSARISVPIYGKLFWNLYKIHL
jgi:hypothetical protein